MKSKTVIKKLKLDQNGSEKIQNAVKNAESKTSGEIAVCLAAESSDYSVWELFASLLCSVFCYAVMLPFSENIRRFYEQINWLSPEWYLPATFGIASFITVLIFFFIFNIPCLDRLIIPRDYRAKTVSKRAFAAFAETGVYCTEHHNRILIYVSYLERQVRIIADKGISEKISDDLWQLIADSLSSELEKGNAVSAYCDAIEKCGELLAEHFPIQKGDVNELPDGLLILEN